VAKKTKKTQSSSSRQSSATATLEAPAPQKSRSRAVAVFVSLVGTVTFTIILLAILQPPPLAGTLWHSLIGFDGSDSADSPDWIFQTEVPITASRWRYIYIHHSRSFSGNAASLARDTGASDHFVIGNGDGCGDGEIQIAQCWNHQESIPTPPDGVARIDPDCISICVVGDFDRTLPTPTQQRRLDQLVGTLQHHLGIRASDVKIYDSPGHAAGIGHEFPIAAFRAQILP
jgi:hypothetical protein